MPDYVAYECKILCFASACNTFRRGFAGHRPELAAVLLHGFIRSLRERNVTGLFVGRNHAPRLRPPRADHRIARGQVVLDKPVGGIVPGDRLPAVRLRRLFLLLAGLASGRRASSPPGNRALPRWAPAASSLCPRNQPPRCRLHGFEGRGAGQSGFLEGARSRPGGCERVSGPIRNLIDFYRSRPIAKARRGNFSRKFHPQPWGWARRWTVLGGN